MYLTTAKHGRLHPSAKTTVQEKIIYDKNDITDKQY
jgi:hypothetical protein